MIQLSIESKRISHSIDSALACFLLQHPHWLIRDKILEWFSFEQWMKEYTLINNKPVMHDPGILLEYCNSFEYKTLQDFRGINSVVHNHIPALSKSDQEKVYQWISDYITSHTQET
jgi:hypothetical protein